MSEEKNLNEIEIDELIKVVYNRIAEWHNDDASSAGLKYVAIDIIQECTNNTLRQLGIEEATTEVRLDQETKKEALKQKQEKGN